MKDSIQHIPMEIFLPPLHIKPRLIKCLEKAVAKTNSKGFQCLSKNFPSISTGELKEGIFMFVPCINDD